jgi:hypothetical protein
MEPDDLRKVEDAALMMPFMVPPIRSVPIWSRRLAAH